MEQIPGRESDHVLMFDPVKREFVIQKIESTFLLRYNRKSKKHLESEKADIQTIPDEQTVSVKYIKTEQQDVELDRLDDELFSDFL